MEEIKETWHHTKRTPPHQQRRSFVLKVVAASCVPSGDTPTSFDPQYHRGKYAPENAPTQFGRETDRPIVAWSCTGHGLHLHELKAHCITPANCRYETQVRNVDIRLQ